MSPIVLIVLLALTSMSASTSEIWTTVNILCAQNRSDYVFSDFPSSLNGSNVSTVRIVLHCEDIILTKPFEVSNLTGLHIKGVEKTRVTCTGNYSNSFYNIGNLILENVSVDNCGSPFTNNHSAVMIYSCKNVSIKNMTIKNSNGTGMILKENKGTVTIEDSLFQNNSRQLNFNQFNGGGLVIKYHQQRVQITNCEFRSNSAYAGGGMAIITSSYRPNLSNIVIRNSLFCSNEALLGGGVKISYLSHQETSITFDKCIFQNNTAVEGGGTAVTFDNQNQNLSFKNCLWQNNSLQAINFESRRTKWSNLTPVFFNCNFTQNGNILNNSVHTHEGNAFVITDLSVQFQGLTIFENNAGSALKAVSSRVFFGENSINKFVGNNGITGGALQLLGRTVILLSNNQTFEFRKNTAKEKGGAIYVDPYKSTSSVISKECFISNLSTLATTRIIFEENSIVPSTDAHEEENILHVVSLSPCLQQESFKNYLMNLPWNNIIAEKLRQSQFSTAAYSFKNDADVILCPIGFNSTSNFVSINEPLIKETVAVSMKTVCITPGKTHVLDIGLVDELCNKVPFDVSVSIENSKINLDGIKVIHNTSITLYSIPGDEGKITLKAMYSTPNVHPLSIDINVIMNHCPPGYVIDTVEQECICSSASASKDYIGIKHCNNNYHASVRNGYWVGYINDTSHTQNTFASSICPEGFCKACSNHSCDRALPSDVNDDTNNYVCSENRQGIMCGKCKSNLSASYHSKLFSCKQNDNCHLGWLFYILSELVPVTIFFLVIIFFNISFTSGPLNGVIFFMQIVDTLKLNGENFIVFEKHISEISKIYRFVYQIFTLKFFALDTFSFCLWKGASALDLLAFRYVTIVYSLFLVVVTIFLLRLCSLNRRMLSLKRSIIHGLSAFLIMSYSECTRVSLSILTVGTLFVSPNNTDSKQFVAFYNGEHPYMGVEHIKYAIPAMFFLVTLVLIPPLLLITYPLCYKVFALLRIGESKCVHIACKIIPLEKIKPLFDSMQSSFKDQYRFFAGMYFLYRFLLQVPFAYVSTLNSYYLINAVQLTAMLVLHAICRPYKNSWHNILDAFFFLLLNTINIITLFNFQQLCSPKIDYKYISAFSTLQCALILLPLVCLIVYTIYCIALKLRGVCRCTKKKKREEHTDDSDYILYELDARSRDK